MIEFIEKEPQRDDSPFTGGCDMYPTYMVKDGKEYFMFNRRDPDDKWRLEQNEVRKKQLLENGGKFFRFHGFYDDPFTMLAEVIERQHHFTEPSEMYYASLEESGFVDFHGNRKEVSAAFFYRIYDPEMAAKIRRTADLINEGRWDDPELVNIKAQYKPETAQF